MSNSFENNSILNVNNKSILLRLIDVKVELNNLENLKNQNSFIKNSNRLESLKKLEFYHEKKMQTFKNRIIFFENYLVNSLNKQKSAMRTANSNRLFCRDMSEKKHKFIDDIQNLKKETKILKNRLGKYEKHFEFIQESVSLFSLNPYADLAQIINRYNSLKYILDENQKLLDQRADNLSSLRSNLHSSIRIHSDEVLYTYESKYLTDAKLKEKRQQTSFKNEINLKLFKQSLDRLRQIDQIVNSINNLYILTCQLCPFNNKNLKSKSLRDLTFTKLNVVKQNLDYLNQILNF